MKRFFEKYELIKLSGLLVVISALLTWVIPQGVFQSTEFVDQGISRIGINVFLENSLMGLYYFTILASFLLVLGGFYQVLSKQAGYRQLIKNISKKLKRCEIPVVLVTSLIFAILCSISNEYLPLLALIPFVVSILSAMKVDKISAFVATFGGLLVGTIGSTFSAKVAQVTSNGQKLIPVEPSEVLTTQTIIFVIAFVILAAFTILRLRKQKEQSEKFEEYDLFAPEKSADTGKVPKTWPYVIGIILFVLVTVLAYLPWETWDIKFFTDLTDKINNFEIFKVPIVSYVFGTFNPFGSWDILRIQKVMALATILISLFGRVSLGDIFESYGEGFKKIGKVVAVLMAVYTIILFNYNFPIVPTIVNWINGLAKDFNGLVVYLGSLVTSLFGVEMQYVLPLSGVYYATLYSANQATILLIVQLAYGFVSFFVPSSAILMMGLSFLDIKYKDWMKFIWKFLLVLLVISIAIILIIA